MKKTQKTIKIILVGACGVGKTSLVSSYLKKPFSNEISPTISPASSNKIVVLENGETVSMQIWDTAGQERFQSISQMFYRGTDVALVCYDQTSVGSLDQWVSRIRAEVSDCFLFLVETKADLMDDERILECSGNGQLLVRRYRARDYFLTSSVDSRGIKELFLASAMCALEIEPHQPETRITEVPKKSKDCC